MKNKRHKSFVQWFLALFAIVFLGCVAAINGIGYVFAASVNTGVTGLSAESSGKATWTTSNGIISGSVTAKATTSCGSTSYSSQNGTLTLTNSSGNVGQLSFDYAISLNGGSTTIDGEDITAGGLFSKKLEAGDNVAVVITSNGSNDTATTISISNIKLTAEKNVTVVFKTPYPSASYGSYTVNGESITAQTTKTFKTTDSVVLAATPASNYKFFGWKNETNGSYISTNASLTTSFSEDITICPEFVSSSTAVWKVSSNYFTDLTNAINYANSSGTEGIILTSNGTLPAGNYTIPSGRTLLLPMDAGYAIVREEPTVIYGSHVTPSAYSLLTMANGATITVANGGTICCAGNLCSTGQLGGWNGCTTGPGGRIKMNTGSEIIVQSGGKLYAWGYIYGSGSVEIQSGGTVYEAFQIKDWRGGTATSNCYSYTFIFNQYYIQNIEVPLKLYAGASEKLWSSANASSSAYPMGATFLGSGGLFNLSTGYLIKDYIEGTDRLQIDIYGNASITTMQITGLPMIGSISTADYEMPITSNITINIHSGTTQIQQNVKFLPGVELNIDSGAFLQINSGKKVYVYDNDDWGNFTGSARLYVIGYSVANGTTAKRNASSLVDALINVNGAIDVKGNLYTSAGGGNITSSQGEGQIVLSTAPGTANSTIYEMAGNSTKTEVTFNPARLHNGGSLVGTSGEYESISGIAAGTKYNYCKHCEKWYILVSTIYTITFNSNGGTGSMSTYTHTKAGHYDHDAPTCGFAAPEGQAFAGWNTASDGSGTQYSVGDSVHVDKATTLYAIWEQISGYTITWANYDGSVLKTDEDVLPGVVPSYTGATPTRAPDAQYTYEFSGWTPTVVAATSNATYTATYSTTVNKYTVIWKNGETTLETDTNVSYGTHPSYDGAEPVKDSTGQYTYTFIGWAASSNPTTPIDISTAIVEGDITYIALFSENTNKYTVTWMNYDGTSILETDEEVPYGSAPSYNGSNPTKPSTPQYSYSFIGWATEMNQTNPISLPVVTSNATYYPVFEEHVREYTVVFKNDDGSTLYSTDVEYGSEPTYSGATPTKQGNAQYSYAFNGWSDGTNTYTGTLPSVTGDTTYTATYSSSVKTYTVTWQNDDGTVLETDNNVPYGTMPSYDGATPTKAATAEFSYSFKEWSPAISDVTGDVTYTATYTETVNTYTVVWKNGDTTLETDTEVPYGTHPSYNGSEPTKASSGQHHYNFIGWSMNPDDTYGQSGEVFTVMHDTTFYAIFHEYVVGLYRDTDGYVYLHDLNGNIESDYTGIFYYDSSIYQGIGDNNYYYIVNGVVQEGKGLVALQENSTTYLFYVLEDGTILKSTSGCTFYVSKTNGYTVNGITVQSGLYYFDASGHMYFGNSLLTGNAEFGVISSSTATIGGGH